ncbi:MotA/TolQ/ExbB proton channel family protein [Pelagicoccus sp. SDUM812003]|uniref:MotA/TolQ/ExbB proton channel family protein n=1 Tax=Pelagicoccus sp. SDUM812003 TaxID=3041267 RepID=UPI00280D0B9E|nr:MotA/TolQ/ExbB proton channel family protein [Pelagicoccus sp. SDUM812003]MDQ8204129.1 MotA/TolQ/ExbB proton channel family protein [Pelagicoccus sp. SDUM812003]
MKPKRAVTLVSVFIIPYTQAAQGDDSSLWAMIQQGGWAMIPLVLTSLAMLTLAIHCFRETRASNFGLNQNVSDISLLLREGDVSKAIEELSNEATTLGRSLRCGLAKLDPRTGQGEIRSVEEEIATTIELEENAISQWIHYLAVIASVAPMIGLLGTVSGMIGGFQTMASGGMGRPELFAGDIGEALITTATGLCIGIPAMVAHSYFNNRLNTLVVETSRRASAVTEALANSLRQPERVSQT